MTIEELEKKKLKLEENYNFKQEEDESWSFEFKNRKAFIINFSNFLNKNIITLFILHRGILGNICDKLFYEIENNLELLSMSDFIYGSMGIMVNLFDKNKMGSIEHFINLIWNNVENIESVTDGVIIIGDIITMIDYSVEKQLGKFSEKELKEIHNKYFQEQFDKGKDIDSEPEKNNLANMIPINQWEI